MKLNTTLSRHKCPQNLDKMMLYQTVWPLQPKGLFANVCSHYPQAMPFLYIRSPEGSLRLIHTAQFLIQIFLITRLARSDPKNSFLWHPCIFLFVLAFSFSSLHFHKNIKTCQDILKSYVMFDINWYHCIQLWVFRVLEVF